MNKTKLGSLIYDIIVHQTKDIGMFEINSQVPKYIICGISAKILCMFNPIEDKLFNIVAKYE